MPRFRIQVRYVREYEVNPSYYDENGLTDERMLAIELEGIDDDTLSFLEGDGEWSITGEIVDATRPPHERRAIEERDNLRFNLQRLRSFFGTIQYVNLPMDEQRRMDQQKHLMEAYLKVLNERIAAFGK